MNAFKESWKLWKVAPYLFDGDVPLGMKLTYLMLLGGYTFMPVDLIPDLAIGVGQTDDVAVAMMLSGGFVTAADAYLSRLNTDHPQMQRIRSQAQTVYWGGVLALIALFAATPLPFLTEAIGVVVGGGAARFAFIQWKENTLLLDMSAKPKRRPSDDVEHA